MIEIEWNKIWDKRIAIKYDGGMHCMAAHKKTASQISHCMLVVHICACTEIKNHYCLSMM
jgi:hypothetical protein